MFFLSADLKNLSGNITIGETNSLDPDQAPDPFSALRDIFPLSAKST